MSTYGKQQPTVKEIAARFWSKVDKSGDCWVWTAAADTSQRTKFSWLGEVMPANRVAWRLSKGQFPDHSLRNVCGNPLCVRPLHWKAPRYVKRPLTNDQRLARWWSRFHAKVARVTRVERLGPCWEWQGASTPAGYGRVSYLGKGDYTHRVAYLLTKGAIPDGLELDHLCRNPCCCNPDHLEAVTHQVNCERSPIHVFFHPELRTKKSPQTHCKNGHELTEANRYKGGRGRCAECARRYAAETAARKLTDPAYQERQRETRRLRHARNRTDPAFRERERQRCRDLYARKNPPTSEVA